MGKRDGGCYRSIPGLILTNTATYEIYFEQDTAGGYLPKQRRLRGANPLQADSGEIILLLDWSQLAGDLSGVSYSTYEVAPLVASTLTEPDFIPELGSHPLAEQSLHLIGHSRGGSLVYEIAKLLGRQGIWVDHITTLDPHPLNNDYDDSLHTSVVDAPARPYSNVLFADNYYQINDSFLGLDPNGQYVIGAYNRYLSGLNLGGYGGFARQHSNVHLWYHGTIDWRTPADDGPGGAILTGLERDSWWTDAETNGFTAGFHYSLAGGGNRVSFATPAGGTNKVSDGMNQLANFGAGVKLNRYALDENLGLWPNLIILNVNATNLSQLPNGRKWHAIESGSSLALRLMYQAGNAQSTGLVIRTFLDADFNPYSDNESLLESGPVAPTGVSAVNTISKAIPAQVEPGVYALGAEISDGSRRRFLYSAELIQIKPAPLTLTIGTPSANITEVTVSGGFGSLVIEASNGMTNWLPVLTNNESAAVWTFTLPDRTEAARFFRGKRLSGTESQQ